MRIHLHTRSAKGGTPDRHSKKSPEDASRTNVNQEHEVTYWCAKSGCTPTELREAVREVGVSAAAVESYRKKKKK